MRCCLDRAAREPRPRGGGELRLLSPLEIPDPFATNPIAWEVN
jgi:hypothetical protein